jgi:hypothetical protein
MCINYEHFASCGLLQFLDSYFISVFQTMLKFSTTCMSITVAASYLHELSAAFLMSEVTQKRFF